MAGKPRAMPSISRLRELFKYDPASGAVTRRRRAGGEVVGASVGTKNSKGHLICRVDYRICYVHRIAWVLHYGVEPPALIDHRNGDGTDNRISNIRSATETTNGINTRPSKSSVSGLRGAHWSSTEQRWRSSIRVQGNLGWFDTAPAAASAYKAAANKYFGEFSYYNRAAS